MEKGLRRADVTVVLAPSGRPGFLNDAAVELIATAGRPFRLIVVEGNATEAVRNRLENLQKRLPTSRILYSSFVPNAAEALDLALPHVETPWVLLTDTRTAWKPDGWLDRLVRASSGSDVLLPSHGAKGGDSLFASRQTLQAAGGLDPARFEALGIPVRTLASVTAASRLAETEHSECLSNGLLALFKNGFQRGPIRGKLIGA